MYEDFVSERITKLRMQKDVSARDMSLSMGQAPRPVDAGAHLRDYEKAQRPVTAALFPQILFFTQTFCWIRLDSPRPGVYNMPNR